MREQDNHKKMMSINTICSTIQFSGSGSMNLLNNLLISDLPSLNNNTFHYTALCNPKGRIICSFWIHLVNDELIYLVCPSNLVNQMLQFFNMRKFRLKITIEQIKKDVVINLEQKRLEFNTNPDVILADDIDLFYLFYFEQNLPWIDSNTTEKFIPQHVNLDQHKNIMSFSKGCYPGQEIIARIKYLGKIKKRMKLIRSKDKALMDNELLNYIPISPIVYKKTQDIYKAQVIVQNN
jgi:folate-binding protein YgfZ